MKRNGSRDDLVVPQSENYDEFVDACETAWPVYSRTASRVLRELTRRQLEDATVHPDGFLKLPIGPRDGVRHGQVRLHFWLPGRESKAEPHGHPWHLASLVLSGVYREYVPVLQEDSEGSLSKFEVLYSPGSDARAQVRRAGEAKYALSVGQLRETREGESHYLPEGPVHMSVPPSTGGITLVVMSPRFRDRASFFARALTNYSPHPPRQEDIGLALMLAESARA